MILQIVAKNMISRGVEGSIVNMSSQASKAALTNHAVYCASKAAVDSLTGVMGLELGPHKVSEFTHFLVIEGLKCIIHADQGKFC